MNRPGPPRIISPGTPNVIRAHLVIISGAAGSGEFIYLGTPGPGTLVISTAAQAGVDQFGNAYPAYIGLFGPGGVLLRNITPTADLIYTPDGGAGNLSVALASFPGVDQFGNAYLQGLTALAGQLSGQTLTTTVLEGQNFRVDEHGVFIYQPPAPPTVVVASANIVTPSTPYLIGSNTSVAQPQVITTGTGTNAADYILVGANAAAGGPAASTTADQVGNTYTKQSNSTTGIPSSVFTSPGGTVLPSGDTITITYAASGSARAVAAIGIPNLPAGAIDQIPTATSGTSTSPSITSGALAQANEVVLAILSSGNAGGAPSWAAGWTPLVTVHTGGNEYLSIAYQNVSSAAAVTASATIVSAAWSMELVSYKESSGAQTTTTLIPVVAPLVLAAPPVPYKIAGAAAVAGAATLVLTVPAGPGTTAGDVIHVSTACAPNTQACTGVADSKGNTYAPRSLSAIDPLLPNGNSFDSGAGGTPTVALVPGDTITLTYSGTTGDKAGTAAGIPNLPSSSFDTTGTSGSSTGTSNNSTNAALREFTEIGIVSLVYTNAGGAVTWDAPDIPLDSQHQGTGVFLQVAYQAISQPPSAITAAPSWAVSAPNTMAIDTYAEQ